MLAGFEDKSAQAICTFAYCEGPGSECIIFQGRTHVCLGSYQSLWIGFANFFSPGQTSSSKRSGKLWWVDGLEWTCQTPPNRQWQVGIPLLSMKALHMRRWPRRRRTRYLIEAKPWLNCRHGSRINVRLLSLDRFNPNRVSTSKADSFMCCSASILLSTEQHEQHSHPSAPNYCYASLVLSP